MYPYAIGLDIGITSVGWAVVALDDDEKPCGIIRMGTRIFDAAEQPKTGASLAAPRREARGSRRRLRRHRHRNERIRQLIIHRGLLTEGQLDSLFEGRLEDVYALRVRALTETLTNEEFARVLIHISQRRGFRSNRKNASSGEDGKILEAVNVNKKIMEEQGYRTVAEMMVSDPRFRENKRNKSGNYISTVTRDMIADEVRIVFENQRKLGNRAASEEFETAYLNILLSQRSFDEGPAFPSRYGGSQIENMVGKCTFETDEKRAAKATYSFQYFNLLEKIVHIRLIKDGVSEKLTDNQRKELVDLAFKTENLNFAKIRKALSIPEEYRFNLVRYSDSPAEECEKKEKFCYLKAYHEIRKAAERAVKGSMVLLSHEDLNKIGTVLTLYKTEEKIRSELAGIGINKAVLTELCGLNFSKFGHLSVKACDKLIPYLEKGMNYDEACTNAGYDFRAHSGTEKSRLLHPREEDFEDITSPVVKRAVSQTIKVLNAIIRDRNCSPTFINIELAREMSKDFQERRKIEKENKENRAANEKLMQMLKEEYHLAYPTGQDLLKLKLWTEQDGICAYSLKPVEIERLFEPGYAEIDHIVPYSISFDDTLKNKVLVLTKENREKGNRLPLQYLQGDAKERFIVWTNNNVRNYRKKNLLLKEKITEEDSNKFKERNLQDTKYMSSFLMNYIRDNLEFAPSSSGRIKRVTAVNGMITSYVRKRWGIAKIRENGDIHHAVDALVIACTTDSLIQQITRYSEFRECEFVQTDTGSMAVSVRTGEVIREFPYPWPWFRKELEARVCDNPAQAVRDLKLPFYLEDDAPEVRPIFVSRMPKRSVTGAAHKETIKSAKIIEEGYTLSKVSLNALKLKDGEIEGYYNPGSDRLLYEALKKRLTDYAGNAEKAFAEPFYKPKSDGTQGPLVRKVKIKEKTTLNVSVHEKTGLADNDSMVRIDVFHVDGEGYYFIPIYVADTQKKDLPMKACVAGKSYENWKQMELDNFIFSLYPNDLIRVEQNGYFTMNIVSKESTLPPNISKQFDFLYYSSANINSGAIKVIMHDNTYVKESLGIKTLKSLEKYTVDVLGNYYPVKKEKRQEFHKR